MLKDELETAKEAAQRAPSKTMKHLVERLRNQLALKEKQQKVDLQCRHCTIIALQNSSFMNSGLKFSMRVLVWQIFPTLPID